METGKRRRNVKERKMINEKFKTGESKKNWKDTDRKKLGSCLYWKELGVRMEGYGY